MNLLSRPEVARIPARATLSPSITGFLVNGVSNVICREFLHNAFDMTDDILLDRVFKRFDADNDGYVNREEWILGLSVFLKGTDTERVQGGREGRWWDCTWVGTWISLFTLFLPHSP